MDKSIKSTKAVQSTGAIIGYEAELWQMSDALRGSMDAAEYKHVVLGLATKGGACVAMPSWTPVKEEA